MEGHKAVELVAHNVDPYKDAMRDNPDGGFIAFLPSNPKSSGPNIPHNNLCIHFTCLFNFRLIFSF